MAISAENLVRRVPEQALRATVPADDALLVIHDVETVRRVSKRLEPPKPVGRGTLPCRGSVRAFFPTIPLGTEKFQKIENASV